jgi:DNA-binding YbaB/EbfC family protein
MPDMNRDLSNIMKEAQKMQDRMQEAQKKLGNLRVKGESGGGMVSIDMDGRHRVLGVKIHPSLLDEDIDMLQDLIAAACNDGVRKVEKASKEEISQLTAGLNIPNDFMKQSNDNKE